MKRRPLRSDRQQCRGALEDKFPGSRDTTGATHLRKPRQGCNGGANAPIHQNGALWTVGIDGVIDADTVGLRPFRPNDGHSAEPWILAREAARRCAKRSSTSSAGI